MHPVLFAGTSSYFVILSLVFCLAPFWILKRAKKVFLDPRLALDVTFIGMTAAFVGARFLHVVYEDLPFYREHPDKIFAIQEGGFVFMGGFVFGLISLGIFLKKRGQNWRVWADVLSPVLSAGYMIGRIACFMAGCCYGRACEYSWAVTFPPGVEAPEGVSRHPTQLYAAGWEAIVLVVLLLKERKKSAPIGSTFYLWLILHGIGRIIMELYRGDDRGPLLWNGSISMWLSSAMIIYGGWRIRNVSSAI